MYFKEFQKLGNDYKTNDYKIIVEIEKRYKGTDRYYNYYDLYYHATISKKVKRFFGLFDNGWKKIFSKSKNSDNIRLDDFVKECIEECFR